MIQNDRKEGDDVNGEDEEKSSESTPMEIAPPPPAQSL